MDRSQSKRLSPLVPSGTGAEDAQPNPIGAPDTTSIAHQGRASRSSKDGEWQIANKSQRNAVPGAPTLCPVNRPRANLREDRTTQKAVGD